MRGPDHTSVAPAALIMSAPSDIRWVNLAAAEQQTWLTEGAQYVVTSATNNTFELATYDASGTITKVDSSGGNDNDAASASTHSALRLRMILIVVDLHVGFHAL